MTLYDAAELALVRLELAILLYFVAVNTLYAALLASAALELRHHLRATRGEARGRVLASEATPSVSMIAPAHNEAATIAASVAALLALHYPDLEVIVVNDGSKDATLEALVREFALERVHPAVWVRIPTRPIRGMYRSRAWPNLVVIDKENGGKADALNAGLNVASRELVCAMDADTLIEPDALQRMVRPFLVRDDVLAAGGTIRVANDSVVAGGRVTGVRVPRSLLAGFQVIEYLRAFLFGRLGWNRLGGNLIISGAFGLFRRDAVLDAGGYDHRTVGEDMELVIRMRRTGYVTGGRRRVDFVPDPVAWTEVPESVRVLGRQRDRWHRGLADSLWRNRSLLFSPRYGLMGMLVFPYFVLVELLAPVIEFIGLLGLVVGLALGMIDVPFAVLFFLLAYVYGTLLSVATLLLEERSYRRYTGLGARLRLLALSLVENLGYRQLTVLWRLRGLIKYVRRDRGWGAMERRGFGTRRAA